MNTPQKHFRVALHGEHPTSPSNVEGLSGIIPPLVTPLTGNGALDVEGLHRLIEHVLAGGVHGLFVLGTTGETASLALDLRREIALEVCRQVQQRVPVLLGVSDASLTNVLELTASAVDLGADAVVVSPPYYFQPTQTELAQFVRRVASDSPVPVYLYNMPELTKTAFAVDTVRQLTEVRNIVGLKDSSGDAAYLARIQEVAQARPNWSLFVGSENLLAESIAGGINGGVTGGANVWPELFVELYEAASQGDDQHCQALQIQLLELNQIYRFGDYGIGVIRGLKCALDLMGICSEHMAEPFSKCDRIQRANIEKKLLELNLLHKKSDNSSRVIPPPHLKTLVSRESVTENPKIVKL